MSSESNGTVAAPSDRTARVVATQVRAMACTSYETGVRNAVQGQTLLRTWTVAKLEQSIPWLKRVNAQRQFDVQAAELSQQGIKVRGLVRKKTTRAGRWSGNVLFSHRAALQYRRSRKA